MIASTGVKITHNVIGLHIDKSATIEVRSLVEVAFLSLRTSGFNEREDLGIVHVGGWNALWDEGYMFGNRRGPRWRLKEGCEVGHRLGQRRLFVKRSFLEDNDL
jgi:hypothetical protein